MPTKEQERRALELIEEHPNWTGAQVAEAAGIEGSRASQRKKVSRLRQKLTQLKARVFSPGEALPHSDDEDLLAGARKLAIATGARSDPEALHNAVQEVKREGFLSRARTAIELSRANAQQTERDEKYPQPKPSNEGEYWVRGWHWETRLEPRGLFNKERVRVRVYPKEGHNQHVGSFSSATSAYDVPPIAETTNRPTGQKGKKPRQ